ncbi:hypothetical protein BSKO_06209 [Bryopsis sp. KO-2023]|nr:hypothetical protein BSKO_06209 [Bryopsis sp. KO-2023]
MEEVVNIHGTWGETENRKSVEQEESTLSIPAIRVRHSRFLLKFRCLTFNINSQLLDPIPDELLGCSAVPTNSGKDGTATSDTDVYVIATQENGFWSPWEKAWTAALGDNYQKIASSNLAAIHLVVFVRSEHAQYLRSVRMSKVATGVGNIVGNKGGVAASLLFPGGRKVLLISSHLAAHDGKVQERNDDYNRIRRGLFESRQNLIPTPRKGRKRNQIADESVLSPRAGETEAHENNPRLKPMLSSMKGRDVSDEHHVTIWMGDLNYRVNGNRRAVQHVLEGGMFEVLHANDQLGKERKRGRAFVGFNEGDITFPPTYKFDKDTDTYDTSSKSRIPSWTDRILWKTGKGVDVGTVSLQQYTSLPSIKNSDHKPVVALFEVDLGRIAEHDRQNDASFDEKDDFGRESCGCTIQ